MSDTDVTIEFPGRPPIHTTTEGIRRAADRLLPSQEAQRRSARRLRESMSDSAELAQDMAAAGVISQESANETARLANAVADKLAPEPATRLAKDQLKSIVERIERLEEEKKTISDDIRDVYAEAKGNGFDVKALRAIVRMRKQDPNERAEEEAVLETYMQALGML